MQSLAQSLVKSLGTTKETSLLMMNSREGGGGEMGRKRRGGRTTGVRYKGARRIKFRCEEEGEKRKGVKR